MKEQKQKQKSSFGKVSQLKGARNLIKIECSCGAIWQEKKDAKDKRAKLRFMKEHAEHMLKSFTATSTVYVS